MAKNGAMCFSVRSFGYALFILERIVIMGAIEELWSSDLCHIEDILSPEAFETMTRITKEQKKLTVDLSPKQHRILEKLAGLRADYLKIVERDSFAAGFRLAMKIMVDSLPNREL